MSWFSKKPKREAEPRQAPPVVDFKDVYYTRADVRDDPALDQVASEADASALQAAMSDLDMAGRAGVIQRLGLLPATSAKAATLSLYMTDLGLLAEGASFALWQVLVAGAPADDLTLLKQAASPTPTHDNYDAASAVITRLMVAALGRPLKVGEMESARQLLARHLRLIP